MGRWSAGVPHLGEVAIQVPFQREDCVIAEQNISSREDTDEGSRIHQVEHLLVSPADLPTPEACTADPRTSSPESGAGCTAWLSRL